MVTAATFLISGLLFGLVPQKAQAYLRYSDHCDTGAVSEETAVSRLCPKHLRFTFEPVREPIRMYSYTEGGRRRQGVYFEPSSSSNGGFKTFTAQNQRENENYKGTKDSPFCYLERRRHVSSSSSFSMVEEPLPLYVYSAPRIHMPTLKKEKINDQEITYKTSFTFYLGTKEEVLSAHRRSIPASVIANSARFLIRCQSETLFCHKRECKKNGMPASAEVNNRNFIDYKELRFPLSQLREVLGHGSWITIDLDDLAYDLKYEREE